ncbi:hypothetical protein MLC35_00930 [Sulfurimonas sp. NW7]|uniref:hypothetical protein n=1 Tax=Sulfurimonas sp. NW7 TaxID=2922727 RepID=UPI003DA8EFFA
MQNKNEEKILKFGKYVCQQTLDYRDDFALYNILKTLKITFYLNKDHDDLLEELLKQCKIKLDLPLFFKKLDQILENLNGTPKKSMLKKSPKQLQEAPLTWLYYAIYFSLGLENKTEKDFINNSNIQTVLLLVIKYHLSYIIYKKDERASKSPAVYKDSTQTIVRIIEYLLAFARENNEKLNNIYFNTKQALDQNFFNLLEDQNSNEKNCFFIRRDKKIGNFLVYQNHELDIHIQIESSRMIRKGESRNDWQNTNIVHYILDGKQYYMQILQLIFPSSDGNGNGGNGGSGGKIQFTEEEEFLRDVIKPKVQLPEDFSHEDAIDALNRAKLKKRAVPANGEQQDIPNLYKQQLQNKAFSANITKRALVLSADYDIPPLPILKDFIHFLTQKPFEGTLIVEDIYKTIFMTDTLLGLGYVKILDLFLQNQKIIKLENNYLKMDLDNNLFSKRSNSYLQETTKKIIYRIPYSLSLLINRVQNYFHDFTDMQKKELYNEDKANEYFMFIKEQIKAYPKHISLNPKHMWKILDSYRKKYLYEDMSTLFCIGRYQQNDTPKLAYASTNKRAQGHSNLVELLYEELDMHICCANLLEIEASVFKKSIEFNTTSQYIGSGQVVLPQKSSMFFQSLKKLMIREENEEKYFNFYALYTRYAMSLLLGTRGYYNSANLDRLSFELHTFVISEKSQTLLSGVRIIPMSKEIEDILKKYQLLAERLCIPTDNIYLINNNKYEIYKTENILNILENYNVEQSLIDFVRLVPLNTGRHAITKLAMETNFNLFYLESFMGHYIAGAEQMGIYSTLDMPDYISKIRDLTSNIAKIYGV